MFFNPLLNDLDRLQRENADLKESLAEQLKMYKEATARADQRIKELETKIRMLMHSMDHPIPAAPPPAIRSQAYVGHPEPGDSAMFDDRPVSVEGHIDGQANV